MIPSSFSIKIFGCTFGVGMTIGIPLIVRNEIAKLTQARIDSSENFKKFFSSTGGAEMSEGEAFSDEAFNNWVPNKQQEEYIVKNWSKTIQHLPASFFNPYLSKQNEKPELNNTNTCYLTILDSNRAVGATWSSDDKFVNIPFPSEKAYEDTVTSASASFTIRDSNDSIETSVNKKDIDPKKYEKILFLEGLYNTTSNRLGQLGYRADSAVLWEYYPKNCSSTATG